MKNPNDEFELPEGHYPFESIQDYCKRVIKKMKN